MPATKYPPAPLTEGAREDCPDFTLRKDADSGERRLLPKFKNRQVNSKVIKSSREAIWRGGADPLITVTRGDFLSGGSLLHLVWVVVDGFVKSH